MDNKEVQLECGPKLQKGHSKVNYADPPLGHSMPNHNGRPLQISTNLVCRYSTS